MAEPLTTAAKLTAQFRTTFADELRSVVVFGSLARGEAIPGVSDLNILILLESTTSPTLVRAAPVLQRWIRDGNSPPYLYSREEWDGMQSTFAIEIADMNDARDVLWGDDPVRVDALTSDSLRQQTAREIRETVLQLRLRLMVATSGPSEIGALLMSGMPSFAAFMRSALRLAGRTPGLDTRSVIEQASTLIDADAAPMLTCFDARRTTHRLNNSGLTDPLVDRYMGFAHRLLAYVEQVPVDPPRAGSDGAGRPPVDGSYAVPGRRMGVK